MESLNEIELIETVLHKVGNKGTEDGIFYSNKPLSMDEDLKTTLIDYFIPAFKSEEFFHFYHEEDLNENLVFQAVSTIFEDNGSLYEQSKILAQHLYEHSTHPKIKSGEFYTIYFRGFLNNEPIDVVGLFKSENKDTFLRVQTNEDGIKLQTEEGINIHKLDKGCLIFNRNKEEGYAVSVVDNTNRSDAQYWIDDFLKLRQRRDAYSNTQDVLTMCKDFVIKELPLQFKVNKTDQADFLNKSVSFFKEKENFDMQEFTDEVITQPDIINSFNQYRNHFQHERDIEIDDQFAISDNAVKKQSRAFKSVIKLDKNFHIYVHGGRNMIEQGEDDKGKFYKVYYKEES